MTAFLRAFHARRNWERLEARERVSIPTPSEPPSKKEVIRTIDARGRSGLWRMMAKQAEKDVRRLKRLKAPLEAITRATQWLDEARKWEASYAKAELDA